MPNAISDDPREYGSNTLYGYIPTMWICTLFVVLYGITSAVHLVQAIHYRVWWLIPTAVLCGVSETIG
jgi:uncharacterized RDD family membrane protein YckC